MEPNPEIAAKFPYPLDAFQRDAAIAIEQGNHVLVTAHTGSGKSLVAEYAIYKAFLENRKVIYTSPIKTLSNQKYAEFKDKFGEANVGIQTGDVKINPDAPCLIMTTEILRNWLFANSMIADLATIIFDEVHYINDVERGHVWEESILKAPPEVLLVMLSATIANPNAFADWIKRIHPNRDVKVVSNLRRPVPLKFWVCVPNPSSFEECLPWDSAVEDGHIAPLMQGDHGSFESATYGKMIRRYEAYVQRNWSDKPKPASAALASQASYNMLAQLVPFLNFLHINRMVPCILFTLSRRRCQQLADAVQSHYVTHEERGEIDAIFQNHIRRLPNHEQYAQVNALRRWLHCGIAVHHSGLFPILKEIVEILFAKGLVKVLFATETFAVGINMPTKTVVFLDVTKQDNTSVRPLIPEEFKQMAGRAGRRGLDTIGHVIYFPAGRNPVTAYDMQSMMMGKMRKIESHMEVTTEAVLRAIASRSSPEDPSVMALMDATLLHHEMEAIDRGCASEAKAIEDKITAIRAAMDTIDPTGIARSIAEQVSALATVPKAKTKAAGRQREALEATLSKSEQRVYGIIQEKQKEMATLEYELERMVGYGAAHALEESIERTIGFLERCGYLLKTDASSATRTHLTPKGVFASEIRQFHEMMATESLYQGRESMEAHREDPVALAALMALFVDESSGAPADVVGRCALEPILGRTLAHALDDVFQKCIEIGEELTKNEIHNTKEPSWRYVAAAAAWAGGGHFQQIAHESRMFEGNLIRAFQKIGNLFDEFKTAYEAVGDISWAHAMERAKEDFMRDVLLTHSLYV